MKEAQLRRLFSPIRIGAFDLSHRVVLAPMTRMRTDLPGNVPNGLMAIYYGQRASEGGLMVTEATYISPAGNGGYASPGIVTDAQVAGWRKITDAVHAKGAPYCFSFGTRADNRTWTFSRAFKRPLRRPPSRPKSGRCSQAVPPQARCRAQSSCQIYLASLTSIEGERNEPRTPASTVSRCTGRTAT